MSRTILEKTAGRDAQDILPLLRGFRIAQERRALTKSTIARRRDHLLLFSRAMAPRSVLTATTADVERWLDSRKLSPTSRYHSISNFHAFYAWAVREKLTKSDPTADIVRPRVRPGLPRPIGDDDLAFALAGAEPRIRAWLTLAAFQGLRCQEIAGLAREDVLDQLDPALLLIRKGKGGKERMLPLHPAVLSALRAHGLPQAGYLFCRRDRPGTSEPVKPFYVSARANEYLHGLNIGSTMHSLRHWHGSKLYAGTRDLRLVQEILGHSSPTTTAIYTQFNLGDAVEAVTSLSVGTGQ